jgi:uncharacterized membrane protein
MPWMYGHWFGPRMLAFCLPLFFIALLVLGGFLAWRAYLASNSRRGNGNEHEEILKQRLAKGEITPEEFERIKALLTK